MTAGLRPSYAPSNGSQIAYLLEDGDGPVIVMNSGTMAGTTMMDEPLFQPNFERFRRFARLLLLDPRGTGRSDPLPSGEPPQIESVAEDVVAVLDHAGIDRAWMYAFHAGVPVAIAVAATHPDRVSGLLLVNGWARLLRDDDIPWGISKRFSDRLIEDHREQYGTNMFFHTAAPSRVADPDVERMFLALETSSSRAQAVLLTTLAQEVDVRPLLATVTVPTLVVHISGNVMVPVEHGRYIAERIPGASYVEVEGTDHAYQLQRNDEVLDELETFVTGTRPRPRAERVFAAVLFTDIVGSTARAGVEGDRRWRELLDTHDRVSAEVVSRYGGTVIKETGDGVLATFDAPSRALSAGIALCGRLADAGLPVRVGIHAGEIERRGDDVSGVGVHIGQRVCSVAHEGEVLVSRPVPDLVLGQPFTFTDRGTHVLKGTPGRWRLFRVS